MLADNIFVYTFEGTLAGIFESLGGLLYLGFEVQVPVIGLF